MPRPRRHDPLPLLVALVLAALALLPGDAGATAWSQVYLNGRAVPVSFNDGDSFRVRAGEYDGVQCRLSGFNTLESFGPGHQWGDWHPYELYVLAKMATYNARRGTWHCFTDGNRDGYGRLLVECPDLVVAAIERGYAHVYNTDDNPSRPEYVRAQHRAIEGRRGMWAHGVPSYLMTSVHSFDEDTSREWHYNRLVSTFDGHSESIRHRETYEECEWVCADETFVDEGAVGALGRSLRADAAAAPLLAERPNFHLEEFVRRFARLGELPGYLDEAASAPVRAHLEAARAAGRLPAPSTRRGACMLYVAFDRRYGLDRATCLREHGTLPPGVHDVWHLGEH